MNRDTPLFGFPLSVVGFILALVFRKNVNEAPAQTDEPRHVNLSPRRQPGSSVGSAWIPAFAGMTDDGLDVAPAKLDSFGTYFALQEKLRCSLQRVDALRMNG